MQKGIYRDRDGDYVFAEQTGPKIACNYIEVYCRTQHESRRIFEKKYKLILEYGTWKNKNKELKIEVTGYFRSSDGVFVCYKDKNKVEIEEINDFLNNWEKIL